MMEKRLEPRLLCADLVDVRWRDERGRTRNSVANLEDISVSGACLQMDTPLQFETLVHISHPKAEMRGRVRYCVYRDNGYFLGVQFEPGSKWSPRLFRPKHLLDLRTLIRPNDRSQ